MVKLNLRWLCVWALTIALPTQMTSAWTIDATYPGGNVIVEQQDAQGARLRQDIRDTEGWWFYWNFAIAGAGGKTLTFHFTDGNVIGTRGPACSTDDGQTWSWLGTESVNVDGKTVSFTHTFNTEATSVRFAFAPPYQTADLKRFLAIHANDPNLAVETLCTSEKGRTVERLHLGQRTGTPTHRILLTARHHSCESVAGYVLEGMMEAMLSDTTEGRWFREHVEALVIPFVDKDGVEEGDQGKNRIPRDHGRDYQGESLYRSTGALRSYVPTWSEGRLRLTLDIHCPHIRGAGNEHIYQVGHASPAIWKEQQRFAHILASIPDSPLPYAASNDMPFGTSWNAPKNYTQGAGVFHWSAELEGVRMASAIEIPYANAGETTILPENARAFGATLLTAICQYLENTTP